MGNVKAGCLPFRAGCWPWLAQPSLTTYVPVEWLYNVLPRGL